MATRAFIQNLIDVNLADNSDILPEEHREVEDALLTEMFPASVKVEWNGTAPVDPTTDIVCNTGLTTAAKCTFKFYFEKVGNRVFVSGQIVNTEDFVSIGGINVFFASFATNLYRPLSTHKTLCNLINEFTGTTLPNAAVEFDPISAKVGLRGSIPAGTNVYRFSCSYKVIN